MSELPVYSLPALSVRALSAKLLAAGDSIFAIDWRVLAITGADALTFLQGQVTTDMREVLPQQSRLGCLLNLKGRVQISFRIMTCRDGFWLVMPAAQLALSQTRLSKFAVFSKVVISTPNRAIEAVLGAAAIQALCQQGWQWPDTSNGVSERAGATLIRLPGTDRGLLIYEASASSETDFDTKVLAEQTLWQAAAIAAGEFTVPASASERYQPQEIDYHQLQGVSYQKGCYMGQEIVARLYFRGQLKSTLVRLQADWPLAQTTSELRMGQSIVTGDKVVGEVLLAAWPATDRLELLALVKNSALASETAPDASAESPLDTPEVTPAVTAAATPLTALSILMGEHKLLLTPTAFVR
jgi:folate-binding protein YgfZ